MGRVLYKTELPARRTFEIRGCNIYDDLGVDSEETLSLCRQKCKKIYVGKRGGRAEKNTSQAEINSLLVELSASGRYKHVVRLKGGDPTIFGRLGNSLKLKPAKIKYDYPGSLEFSRERSRGRNAAHGNHARREHFACISGHDAKTNPDAFRDLADVRYGRRIQVKEHRERRRAFNEPNVW